MFQPNSSAASSAGGASSDRTNLSEFTVVKAFDRASVKIYESCCKGQHIKTVLIELCKAAGGKFLEIKMEDVVISGVSPSGDTTGVAELPSETVSFNFAKILWTYFEERDSGAASGNLVGGWDLTKNRSWSP